MTRMDIDEDISRAETIARTIKTFAEIEGDSGEEFVGYNDIEDSESNTESEDALTLKAANKALRRKIEALKAQVGGGARKGLGGKKASQKVTFASGLRPDWDLEAEAVKSSKRPTHVQISFGGLEDSDAEDTNPFPLRSNSKATHQTHTLTEDELTKGAQKATRDLSRRNELVTMIASDQEEDYAPHPSMKKVAAKIPLPVRVKPKKCIAIPVSETLPPVKATAVSKTNPKHLNGNKVRTSDLPEFAKTKWRHTFLPTLYDKFFASDQLFDAFYKGTDQFVALLQATVSEVYPDIDYEVTSSDSIHFLAYNRVNEKRSSIGSNAVSIIKDQIDSLRVAQAAKDWLRWARRVDGPLFFQVPSPIGSPIDQSDPGYQFPRGRLLSPFVINLATSSLKLKAGSASKNGFPKGLVALIMAALERAVKHFSKPSDKILDFSKEFWGSKVGIYYDGFHGENGVPDSRWKELVDACLGHSEDSEGDGCEADLSILDNNRALVFGFRSPTKPRT